MRLQCFTNRKHTLKKRGWTIIEKQGFRVLQIGNAPLKEHGFDLH
jgi:hypothetical protein